MEISAQPELTLYGAYFSRPFRVCWMLKELGLPYAHVPVQPESEDIRRLGARTDWYRAINPNARIPTLKHGDFLIWESSAINLYLVQTFGGPLRPETPEGFGRALQWSFFAANDIEPPMVPLRRMLFKTAVQDRDPHLLQQVQDRFRAGLAVIDQALAQTGYLQGPAWGLADFVAASVLYALEYFGYEGYASFGRLRRWLDVSYGRPAARQAIALCEPL